MLIAERRDFNYKYEIISTYEVGVVLKGYEVKHIRKKKLDLKNSFIKIIKDIPYLFNINISNNDKHILLLKKNEIVKIYSKAKKSGLSIVPVSCYWKNNFIKFKIALVKGKKIYEKKKSLIEKEKKKEIKFKF